MHNFKMDGMNHTMYHLENICYPHQGMMLRMNSMQAVPMDEHQYMYYM